MKLLIAFLSHMAVLSLAAGAAAQTPPRPAVDVRQLPDLWHNVTPADFNGDGRVDLIAGERTTGGDPRVFGRVVVRLGNGNGTFGSASPVGVSGKPVAVGDFNRDNRLDVVVTQFGGDMWILPGRGNGSFDPPRTLDDVADFRFGLAADLNADSILDLVIGHGTTVEVQPGNGDFTFGPTMVLPPGNDSGPTFAIVANLNADNRPDLAVAQTQGSVFVYLNDGGLLFSAREVAVADDTLHEIASGDLDGDGDQDLVVAHSQREEVTWSEGGVEVLLGNGSGAFAAPVTYATGLIGPWTVATGDFNRDGTIDVAIGSRSFGWDDLSNFRSYCDSLAIFPGRGNGTLASAAIFRLDNFPVTPGPFPGTYVDSHHALTTADVDGDTRLDLIASVGAVVLNRPAVANRPPTADAGPDRTVDAEHMTILSVTASDPDWDWLVVEWRDDDRVHGRQPVIEYFTREDRTVTVTVTDGRGGTATDTVNVDGDFEAQLFVDVLSPTAGASFASGADVPITWDAFDDFPFDHFRISVSRDNFATSRLLHEAVPSDEREFTWHNAGPSATTWRVRVEALDAANRVRASDTSEAFTIRTPATGALPWPWQHTPVGADIPAGNASYSRGTFTVRGGGADIWGTADAFRFVYQPIDGDFTFKARVASVAGSEPWTKVGLMVRESLSANSAHHFLLASISKGLAYQRRVATGGSSANTNIGTGGAPVVFRISRVLRTLTLQMAANETTPFVTVATADMAGPVYIGLATSSHDTSQLATATFDGVEVFGGVEQPTWTNFDIGEVGAPGGARESAGRWTVFGSGADVWGTSDELHFVRTSFAGNFEFTARVFAVENVHQWTKAGLMMREHLGAGARHGFMVATPRTTKGLAFQRRAIENQDSISTSGPAIVPPVYLKLVRAEDVLSAYYRRSPSDAWTLVDQQTYPSLNFVVDVGFAVSSHIDGRLATAIFDQVSLTRFRPLRSQDVGNVGIPGSTNADPINIEMRASGADIWGRADAFRYAYANITADATITARVTSIDGAHRWTKAGVMIRTSADAPASYAMVMVTPGRGIAMQVRRVVGEPAVQIAVVPGVAPAWVRLTREGDPLNAVVTGSYSFDGVTWTTLGSSEVAFNTNGLAGLALTSHNNSALATATFDNVTIIEPQ